jgi:nucleoside phosphorylase
MVEASGTIYSVAEIGEQFAWIGAALRSSPYEEGVACSTPIIEKTSAGNVPQQSSSITIEHSNSFGIHFVVAKKEKEHSGIAQCQCWHGMFKNPVVVQGYPIRRRSENNTGLEIPLDMMAVLTRARRANTFNRNIFIKGYSSLLVLTRKSGDLLLWHLLRNESGDRVSYLDYSGPRTEDVDVDGLEKARHVVGWCSRARNYAGKSMAIVLWIIDYDVDCSLGAANATYTVGGTNLSHCTDCAFKNATIYRGRLFDPGTMYGLGEKDIPGQNLRDGQDPQLRFISRQYVVLWDEEDKRGWLVNGATALLHLLRASLEYNKADMFSSGFSFKAEEVEEFKGLHTAKSAIDFLLSHTNRRLELYPGRRSVFPTQTDHTATSATQASEKGSPFRLEDRIEELSDVLATFMDFQSRLILRNGARLDPGAHESLKGWDFKDLAESSNFIKARKASFFGRNQSWGGFVESISAIVLFGHGFGELIQPEDPGHACVRWARMPKQQYYLAAMISDLKNIMRSEEHPEMLSDGFIWHSPDQTFASCHCTTSADEKHADPVQVLLSSKHLDMCPKKEQILMHHLGAVIFGHNNHFCSDLYTFMTRELSSTKRSPIQSFNNEANSTSPSIEICGGVDASTSHDALAKQSSNPQLHAVTQSAAFISEVPTGMAAADNARPKPSPPERREHFNIAIICALQKECDAVEALFDGNWRDEGRTYGKKPGDPNSYSTGWIGEHNVVLVCMSNIGKVEAANVSCGLLTSFPSIKLGLLVGICGGVPQHAQDELLLGDIIVSTGIVQFDIGRRYPSNFERKRALEDSLGRPNSEIRTYLQKLQGSVRQRRLNQDILFYLRELQSNTEFGNYEYPGVAKDRLYRPDYHHKHRSVTSCDMCTDCDGDNGTGCTTATKASCAQLGCGDRDLVSRQRLTDIKSSAPVGELEERSRLEIVKPKVHFGRIASGDTVMKSGVDRDRIALQERVVGFEMEGAGLWDRIPTIIVKGICDYADSHKDKVWQNYAAATAAACMKAMLSEWEVVDEEWTSNKRRRP